MVVKSSNEATLAKMLSIIKQNPGIRPSELNRHLSREHSNHYRQTLIRRGLIRKERKGAAVHYYAKDK